MQPFGRLTHFKAILLVGVLTQLTACRLREGEHCLCADDCRGGLACVTDQGALDPGTCVTDDTQSSVDPQSGMCLDQGEQAGGQAPDVRPPLPWDTSKRDLPQVGEDTGGSSGTAHEDSGTASSGGTETTDSGTGIESSGSSEGSGSTLSASESSGSSSSTDAQTPDSSESTTSDSSESTTSDSSESTTSEAEMNASSSSGSGAS